LDQALRGGIRVGTVTELVGRAGVGKTQLAFQLCVMAAKYNQGTMYIDTEKKLTLQRLREMSQERFQQQDQGGEMMKSSNGAESPCSYNDDSYSDQENRCDNNNNTTSVVPEQQSTTTTGRRQRQQRRRRRLPLVSYKRPEEVFSNLTVTTPGSTEELMNVLEEKAEMEILQRNHTPGHFPVRLLVVDSIAAPLKRDFGSDAAPQRAAAVFRIAQTLKRLADQLHLAVVVMNQASPGVVDSNNNNSNSNTNNTNNSSSWGRRGISMRDSDGSVRAALGTSWHHCVSTRLLMEHQVEDPHRAREDHSSWNQPSAAAAQQQQQQQQGQGSGGQGVRQLSVVKSNVAAFSTLSFQVTTTGIVEASSSSSTLEQQENNEE
jgi:RAD51-like protein 1